MGYLISGLQSALNNELNWLVIGTVLLFTCAWAFLAVLPFRWDEHSTLLTSSPRRQAYASNFPTKYVAIALQHVSMAHVFLFSLNQLICKTVNILKCILFHPTLIL
jgi:hypothetical protein